MVSKEKRGTGGLVPSECQVQLLLASRENDWGLTPADFFPPEVLAPADADAPVAEAEGTIALMALANGGCREEARRELVDIRNAVDAAILDLDAHDEAVATAPLRGVVK